MFVQVHMFKVKLALTRSLHRKVNTTILHYVLKTKIIIKTKFKDLGKRVTKIIVLVIINNKL